LWFDVNIDYYKTLYVFVLHSHALWFDVNIDYYKTRKRVDGVELSCGLM
jgi:hypothetical protein